MADIVLINPRFEVSYWGLEHALPLLGKKANLPVACLPLLAALTPPEHRVTLLDENVAALDYDRLARADLVGLTGMSVQRFRMREVLTELKRRGVFTAVGGPWVSVQEDYFGDLADVVFVGEAEETWPDFLRAWQGGRHGLLHGPRGGQPTPGRAFVCAQGWPPAAQGGLLSQHRVEKYATIETGSRSMMTTLRSRPSPNLNR
jgi:hypothetical protein